MLALAIEGSTSRASICLKKDSEILYQEFSDNPKTHSEFLNAAIERGLKSAGLQLSQIDVFACSTGPGSFTGIRVSSSIIKSFAMIFKKPMFTTDSLSVMAMAAYEKDPSQKQILCLTNAHKNMVYAAIFENGQISSEIKAHNAGEILNFPDLDQALGLGDGFAVYKSDLKFSKSNSISRDLRFADFPDAGTLCDLAIKSFKNGTTIEWNLYKPLYIRESEAEEVLKLKKNSAKNLT